MFCFAIVEFLLCYSNRVLGTIFNTIIKKFKFKQKSFILRIEAFILEISVAHKIFKRSIVEQIQFLVLLLQVDLLKVQNHSFG
jgi:hypothetical protein